MGVNINLEFIFFTNSNYCIVRSQIVKFLPDLLHVVEPDQRHVVESDLLHVVEPDLLHVVESDLLPDVKSDLLHVVESDLIHIVEPDLLHVVEFESASCSRISTRPESDNIISIRAVSDRLESYPLGKLNISLEFTIPELKITDNTAAKYT